MSHLLKDRVADVAELGGQPLVVALPTLYRQDAAQPRDADTCPASPEVALFASRLSALPFASIADEPK